MASVLQISRSHQPPTGSSANSASGCFGDAEAGSIANGRFQQTSGPEGRRRRSTTRKRNEFAARWLKTDPHMDEVKAPLIRADCGMQCSWGTPTSHVGPLGCLHYASRRATVGAATLREQRPVS